VNIQRALEIWFASDVGSACAARLALSSSVCLLLVVAFVTNTLTAGASELQVEDTPESHLGLALDRRYDFDIAQVVHLIVRSSSGELRRTLEMASKRVDGQLLSVGKFVEPSYLRGTKLLMIENEDRNADFFLYLRSQGRSRRISSAQRRDSFMGTDMSYEDFEQRTIDDFSVEALGDSEVAGEVVYVFKATPTYDSSYDYTEYYVSKADHAILESRHFVARHDGPSKIIRIPRDTIATIQGHLIPTVIHVENSRTRTSTEVQLDKISVNPELDDRLFSARTLENSHPIPHMKESAKTVEPKAPVKKRFEGS
jgi:hypothetical protein